jgi:hypothetical protein
LDLAACEGTARRSIPTLSSSFLLSTYRTYHDTGAEREQEQEQWHGHGFRLPLHFLLTIGTPSGAQPCDLGCPVDWRARPLAWLYSLRPPGRPLCPTVYLRTVQPFRIVANRSAAQVTNGLPVRIQRRSTPRPGQLALAKVSSSGLSCLLERPCSAQNMPALRTGRHERVSCQKRNCHDDLAHRSTGTVLPVRVQNPTVVSSCQHGRG